MKFYYYFFYKLYKFWEFISLPKFWSDFKANISLAALEIWLIFIFVNYYNVFINRDFHLERSVFFFILGVIIVFHSIVFVHFDKWKEYNARFDQLPRWKNIIGGIIVWAIVISIIIGYWTPAYWVQKEVLGMK